MQYIEKDFKLNRKHKGLLNKDYVIYLIKAGSKEQGFFAAYRSILELMYLADISNMIPVVEFGKDFPYAESGKINGYKNPYEYYFCQPSTINIFQAKKSYNVVESCDLHNMMVQQVFIGKCGTYETTTLYMRQMARIQRKYIKLNSVTEQYVNQGISNKIEECKVLGVHVRGSDFRKNYNIHPEYISEMEYLEAVEKEFIEKKWDKIFLATDDVKILKLFKSKFKGKLDYYDDVYRAKAEKSVAFSQDERTCHRYKLGLEVIRDVYTLAACDGLIAGVSQVSTCARIIKISQDKKDYDFLKILYKGTNHNNRNFIVNSINNNENIMTKLLRGWNRNE